MPAKLQRVVSLMKAAGFEVINDRAGQRFERYNQLSDALLIIAATDDAREGLPDLDTPVTLEFQVATAGIAAFQFPSLQALLDAKAFVA